MMARSRPVEEQVPHEASSRPSFRISTNDDSPHKLQRKHKHPGPSAFNVDMDVVSILLVNASDHETDGRAIATKLSDGFSPGPI